MFFNLHHCPILSRLANHLLMSLVWIMYVHTFTLMNFLQICIVIESKHFLLKFWTKCKINGIEDHEGFFFNLQKYSFMSILYFWGKLSKVHMGNLHSYFGCYCLCLTAWLKFADKICHQSLSVLWCYCLYGNTYFIPCFFFFSSFINVPYEKCLWPQCVFMGIVQH